MSKDWTPEEISAASKAMEAAGELGYEDFCVNLKIIAFAKVQRNGHFPCPRCGNHKMNSDPIRNALSRKAEVYVCDDCGTDEAMRDFARCVLPLKEWAIAKNPEAFLAE